MGSDANGYGQKVAMPIGIKIGIKIYSINIFTTPRPMGLGSVQRGEMAVAQSVRIPV